MSSLNADFRQLIEREQREARPLLAEIAARMPHSAEARALLGAAYLRNLESAPALEHYRAAHADLLLVALKAALRASDSIGGMGVITHPLDEALRGFYARWGFQDIPFDPRRAMIVRMVDVKRNFGESDTPEK